MANSDDVRYAIEAINWVILGAYVGLILRHLEDEVRHARRYPTWRR